MGDENQRNKIRNWIFIIIWGVIFLSSVAYQFYLKTFGLNNESLPLGRMMFAYWVIVRPLIAMSGALFLMGLLDKVKILNLHAVRLRGKRISLIIGAVLVGITIFYMLLLGIQLVGFNHNEPWLIQLVNSQFYLILTKPFYSPTWENEVMFLRDILAFFGAAFLYLTRTGEVINQEERKEDLKL